MPRSTQKPSRRTAPPAPQPVTVEPAWLIKAIGATVVAALICAYLAVCFLFYQGQWQLVLHPTRTKAAPQSIGGAPYEAIHFGPDASATPQLTGWWIPVGSSDQYGDATLLFLPAGDGSLQDSIPTLAALHDLGINVFAFDYRGYGQSANMHPSQQRMTQDVDAAWSYLTGSRSISAAKIIVYGTGVGASLAVRLAADHPAVPGIILDAPDGDLLDVALRDQRSRLAPVSYLFHERFPLAQPLQQLRTPKLLLTRPDTSGKTQTAFRSAAMPKTIAEVQTPNSEGYRKSINLFLNECLHVSPAPQK